MSQIGLFLNQEMTKYEYKFSKETILKNINRLTNQLWKLIPMRENNEEWKEHLSSLIIEISGLNEIFDNTNLLILLSKLEGLNKIETDFSIYRKTVFEAISQLREVVK